MTARGSGPTAVCGIPARTWTFVCATYDSVGMSSRFYVNGLLVSTNWHNALTNAVAQKVPFCLFGSWNNGKADWMHYWMDGMLDDVRIWDVAISSNDQRSVYEEANP